MTQPIRGSSSSSLSSQEEEWEEVLPGLRIVPLNSLQEVEIVDESQDLTSEGRTSFKSSRPSTSDSSSKRQPARGRISTPKKGVSQMKPGTPKSIGKGKKSLAERAGMKFGAMHRYLPIFNQNCKPEMKPTDEVDRNDNENGRISDEDSPGRNQGTVPRTPSSSSIESASIENTDPEPSGSVPLLIQSSSNIFATPVKSNASVVLEPSVARRLELVEESIVSPCQSRSPDTTPKGPIHFVRNLDTSFSTVDKCSSSSSNQAEVDSEDATIPTEEAEALPTSSVPIGTNGSLPSNDETVFSRRPKGPPKQQSDDETKRRVEEHFRRMNEEGASLHDVGIYTDSDSRDSFSSTDPSERRRRSMEMSRIGEAPVKRERKKTKAKFTRSKSRRMSLESVGSSSIDSSSPTEGSTGQKRSISNTTGIPGKVQKIGRGDVKTKAGNSGGKMTPDELAALIEHCFLKLSKRKATKQEQEKALEVLKLVVEDKDSPNVFLEGLSLVNQRSQTPNPNNPYWTAVADLFQTAAKETTDRKNYHMTSSFLKLFHSLLIKSYDEHSKLRVKVRMPLIAIIMQGSENARNSWSDNVRDNFRELMKQAFLLQVKEESDEFLVCMDWLNITTKHYYTYQPSVISYLEEPEMVAAFMSQIEGEVGATNFGHTVLRKIEVPQFGRAVLSNILHKVLHLVDFDLDLTPEHFSKLLRSLAQSNLVDSESGETPVAPKERVTKQNVKGESPFHRACVKDSTAFAFEVDKLFNDPGDSLNINVKDNAGHSCLHESAYYGRLESIQYLATYCWKPFEKAGRYNVNILSQNSDLNTPLHLSVQQAEREAKKRYQGTDFPIVKEILGMVMASECTAALQFQLKNRFGNTILDCCPNTEFGGTLRQFLISKQASIPKELSFDGVILPVRSFERIRGMQTFIASWATFDTKCLR